ncbi:hypothetical protein H2O64_19690 [Kordia sp. YSTF-M3]|uniref:Uncharacterized protein n=1 Tax=Kordia aestuariivivens TaxID=2759037 RepID=A0ABR7QEW1_9FLAO|nr:hypothetical protein [Kordia aestuariivivens]MBC8756906.1 hypothetical protein [Kordia aestuariivivens]
MKNLKKISLVFAFLALAITNVHGSEINKNELIHRMSNDTDVADFCITLLKEKMTMNVYGNAELIKNSELLKDLSVIKAENAKIVRNKYPELLKLELNERREVFNEVLSKSTNYKNQLKCLGMNILRLAAAEIFVGTGFAVKWKLTKLGLCAAAAVAVDAAEEVESAGLVTGTMPAQVAAETKFCIAISTALQAGQLLIIEEGVRRILFACSNDTAYDFDKDADEDGVND